MAQKKDGLRPRHHGLIGLSKLHEAALLDGRGFQTRRASPGLRDRGW